MADRLAAGSSPTTTHHHHTHKHAHTYLAADSCPLPATFAAGAGVGFLAASGKRLLITAATHSAKPADSTRSRCHEPAPGMRGMRLLGGMPAGAHRGDGALSGRLR